MVEVYRPAGVIEIYRPVLYDSKQPEYSDIGEYLLDDIALAGNIYPRLNRWRITNEITASIQIPVKYSQERNQFEIDKSRRESLREFHLLVRDDVFEVGEFLYISSGTETSFNTAYFYDDVRNDGKLITRTDLNVYGSLINNGIVEVGW
jgi:hypothetical protein